MKSFLESVSSRERVVVFQSSLELDLTNGRNRKRILHINFGVLEVSKEAKGGRSMAKQIEWEASLTTAKAKARKGKKLILMDFYNNH